MKAELAENLADMDTESKQHTIYSEGHDIRIVMNFTNRCFFVVGLEEIPTYEDGTPIHPGKIQKGKKLQITFKLTAESMEEKWQLAKVVAGWDDVSTLAA